MRSGWLLLVGLGGCDGCGSDFDRGGDDTADTDVPPASVRIDAVGACSVRPETVADVPHPLVATSRPDFFYPYGPGVLDEAPFGTDDAPAYPEAGIDDPEHGRRVTIVGTAEVAGALVPVTTPEGRWRAAYDVRLNGRPASELLDEGVIDWIRVHPTTFDAGDPIWVMFHTRGPDEAAWDSVEVEVPTAEGTALAGEVALGPSALIVDAVVPSVGLERLRVYVRAGDRAQAIGRVFVNGVDVGDVACAGEPADLTAGQSAVIDVLVPGGLVPGQPWTLVIDGAQPVVAAGRVVRPHFPIHTWPTERDCPLPGVNDAAFRAHLDAGYDTFFLRAGYGDNAGCTDRPSVDAVEADFAAADAWAMPDDFGMTFTDRSRVLARLLGDEVDDKSLETLTTTQVARRIAEGSTYWADLEPEVPTYIGGSRHRFTGMFAGAADLQGMDFYAAACAPHITDFGAHPPLRGPYDYLVATVRNHAPLPTWLYTQGLGNWPGQPSPSEYRVQALSVIAAGAKGLMTFQTRLDDAAEVPATWAEMQRLNVDLRAIRDLVIEGAAVPITRVVDGRGVAGAVRTPLGVVLVVFGLETIQGPSDLECALQTVTPWVLADQPLGVAVDLPHDLGVQDVFEVRDGAVVEALDSDVHAVTVDGRTLRLDTRVDDTVAGRIFVLGADGRARAAVEAALAD